MGAILRWPHCPHSDPLPENEVKLPSPIRLDAIDCAISPSISDCCSKLTLSIRLLRQTVHCTLPPISGKSYGSLGLPFLKREERSLFLFSHTLRVGCSETTSGVQLPSGREPRSGVLHFFTFFTLICSLYEFPSPADADLVAALARLFSVARLSLYCFMFMFIPSAAVLVSL